MPSADPTSSPSARGSSSTKGLTRRRFVQGVGAAGVAAVGTPLVTTRVAYAATSAGAGVDTTLITIFLRGGADGLRILPPNSVDLGVSYLRQVRASLVPGETQVIPLPDTGGWALNKALSPLYDLLWESGELAFVPAVSAPGVTRSHFQAQLLLEKGGATGSSTGWLDRVLTELGPGTTFRALSEGWRSPDSMAGNQAKIAMSSLADFDFPGWTEIKAPSQKAVLALYNGLSGPLAEDVPATIAAVQEATAIRAGAGVQNGAVYPTAEFSTSLKDLADILRAEVGLRVATIDVQGWDTHTDEANDLDRLLAGAAACLTAFMTDLGPERRSRVTVVVQSEFGRRVPMNLSAGADHGTGGLMWLLGGGLVGKAVHGKWRPLMSAADLADGDVPMLNNAFDVLGEIVQKRLGVGSLSAVFPNRTQSPLGVARTG
jgi:uncharacterized protein (DUF1501 family)